MARMGESLRSAREAKGISLAQAEEATKIRALYLQAIEEENYGNLPPLVFVRGFIRNYATYLGLNPEEVLRLEGAPPPEPETPLVLPTMEEAVLVPPVVSRLLLMLAAVALLALVVGLGGWAIQHGYIMLPGFSPTATPTFLLPTATPSLLMPTHTATLLPTATPTHSPTPEPGVRVDLQIVQRAWLRVLVDGVEVFTGILEAGERRTWTGKERVYVHCGFGMGVVATVNGQPYGPLSSEPAPVRVEWSRVTGPPSLMSTPGPTIVLLQTPSR
ncbi:MAG: helix-turn-helix domain-containing protein [Chloroflexi bacterium]|nr:helix-turn-helix domain-containing protein [Chloroflexota bacterium]